MGAFALGLVRPCGVVASCCCWRPTLNRRMSPLVKLLSLKLKFSVHSCSVVLLGSGFDGAGAGLLRVWVTSAEFKPTKSPKRNVEVKTMPGVNLYKAGVKKSIGMKPLKFPPVGFPPVCGVASGLKLSVLKNPEPV